MSEKLNGLFSETNEDAANGSGRSLAGTAQLTNLSAAIANDILKKVDADFAPYRDKVNASKSDHNVMDALVAELYDMSTVDCEFLTELDETTIDNMLKSQQSKRSRSKGKTMTMDNYRNLMVGAIAEGLIRLTTHKDKHSGTSRRTAGAIEYTPEQLEELNNDQEKLRKEIRNIQSKKSIAKSKIGYDEAGEQWQTLLIVEAQLKSLRTSEAKTVLVDETKNKLSELLQGVDINQLKPADAKKLIEQAAALISQTKEEATTNDESNV